MQLLAFFGARHKPKINPGEAVRRAVAARKDVESAAAEVKDAVCSLGVTIERALAANAKITGRKRK